MTPVAPAAARVPLWRSVAATGLAVVGAFLCVGWIASIGAFSEVFAVFGAGPPAPTAWVTGHALFVDVELAGIALALAAGTAVHWFGRSPRSARWLMLGAAGAILVGAGLFGLMYLPIWQIGRVT